MCRLRNIAMRDYQESVTSTSTSMLVLLKILWTFTDEDRETDTRTDRQTPDKWPLCAATLRSRHKICFFFFEKLNWTIFRTTLLKIEHGFSSPYITET